MPRTTHNSWKHASPPLTTSLAKLIMDYGYYHFPAQTETATQITFYLKCLATNGQFWGKQWGNTHSCKVELYCSLLLAAAQRKDNPSLLMCYLSRTLPHSHTMQIPPKALYMPQRRVLNCKWPNTEVTVGVRAGQEHLDALRASQPGSSGMNDADTQHPGWEATASSLPRTAMSVAAVPSSVSQGSLAHEGCFMHSTETHKWG